MEWRRWGVCMWEWWLGLLTLTLTPWDSPSDSAVLGIHTVGLTKVREVGDKSVLWLLTPRAGISYFPSLTYCHSSGGFKMGMLVPLKVLRRWAWHLAPFCCMIPQQGSKAWQQSVAHHAGESVILTSCHQREGADLWCQGDTLFGQMQFLGLLKRDYTYL